MPPPVEARKKPIQKRARATVDAILEATAQVLREDGFDKASTNRIAKRAGVSVGSLYQYFPNKEALVMAVTKRHAEEIVALLARTTVDLADAPIEQGVRGFIRGMFAAHQVDPDLHRVLVAQAMSAGLEHFRDIDEQARKLVMLYLARRRDELVVDDFAAASFLLVMTVDAIIHAHPIYDPEDVSLQQLEQELVAMLVRYLTGCGRLTPVVVPTS